MLSTSTRPRLIVRATMVPAAVPAIASNALSVSVCATSRPRDAPIATRTASSRSRAIERASITLLMFAQAMSSTSPVVARSSQSACSYRVRQSLTPRSAVRAVSLKLR